MKLFNFTILRLLFAERWALSLNFFIKLKEMSGLYLHRWRSLFIKSTESLCMKFDQTFTQIFNLMIIYPAIGRLALKPLPHPLGSRLASGPLLLRSLLLPAWQSGLFFFCALLVSTSGPPRGGLFLVRCDERSGCAEKDVSGKKAVSDLFVLPVRAERVD